MVCLGIMVYSTRSRRSRESGQRRPKGCERLSGRIERSMRFERREGGIRLRRDLAERGDESGMPRIFCWLYRRVPPYGASDYAVLLRRAACLLPPTEGEGEGRVEQRVCCEEAHDRLQPASQGEARRGEAVEDPVRVQYSTEQD